MCEACNTLHSTPSYVLSFENVLRQVPYDREETVSLMAFLTWQLVR